MGLTDILGRGGPPNRGDLTGTLGGFPSVSETPTRVPPAGGVPSGMSSVVNRIRGRGWEMPPILADQPTGHLFSPQPRSVGVEHANRQWFEKKEGEIADVLGGVVKWVSRPIGKAIDVLLYAERPQQAMWSGAISLMEGEGIPQAFSDAAGSFLHLEPDKNMPKRRVSAGDLVNAIGKRFLGKENFREDIHPVGRAVLEFGLLVGLDPLLFVPGIGYGKFSSRFTRLSEAADLANKSRLSVTKGGDLRAAGKIVSETEMGVEIQKILGDDRPLGVVYKRLGSEIRTEVEADIVRDFMTGLASRNVLAARISDAITAGKTSPEEAAKMLGNLSNEPISMNDVDQIQSAVSKLLSKYRGSGEYGEVWVNRVSVQGRKRAEGGYQMVTLESGPSELIAGQLINKFGLAPMEAFRPEVLSGARKAISSDVGSGLMSKLKRGMRDEDYDAVWGEMGVGARKRVLRDALGAQGAKALKKTFANLNASSKSMVIDTAAGSTKGDYLASMTEMFDRSTVSRIRGALQKQWVKSASPAEKTAKLPVRKPAELMKRVYGESPLPPNASQAAHDAVRRARDVGPYIGNQEVVNTLSRKFMSLNLTNRAALEMAEFITGVRPLTEVSDIPYILSHPGVMENMLDASNWTMRDYHILNGVFDPQTVLPAPVYAKLKLAMDLIINESNFIGKKLDDILVYGGSPLKEGGHIDELLARALDGNKVSLDTLKNLDDGGEGYRLYGSLRMFYDGWAKRFAKLGFEGFTEGKPISEYFPHIYRTLQSDLDDLVAQGMISADEALKLTKRYAGREFGALVSPLELDFVQGTSINFGHLKQRTLPSSEALEYSATKSLRSYMQGALRKIHLEPAIKEVNGSEWVKQKLSRGQAHYLKNLLKRLRGVESDMEASLNDMASSAASALKVNLPIRPATKASLFITKAFYMGLLGGNVGFFLKNLSQGINTSTRTGPINFFRGASLLSDKEFRNLASNRNLLADWKAILEESSGGGKRLGYNLRKILFSTATGSEAINRGIAFGAGMSQYMRKVGVSDIKALRAKGDDVFNAAVRYGHSIANETQFTYGVVGRAPIAGTPLGRMGLQFFSWPIKQLEFLGLVGDRSDRGVGFLLEYILLSGMFSKLAEHANVDAGSFAGFGFFPGGMSPAAEAIYQAGAGIHEYSVNGNSEEGRKHFKKLTAQLEYMIPGFLQFEKTRNALESYKNQSRRGYRDRYTRGRTPGWGKEVLDATINPLLNRYLDMPDLYGEDISRLFGLPTVTDREERGAIRDMLAIKDLDDRKAREAVDAYWKFRADGDYVAADEVLYRARVAGIPITRTALEGEMKKKRTPTTARIMENVRMSSRGKIEDMLRKKYPKLYNRDFGTHYFLNRPKQEGTQ